MKKAYLLVPGLIAAICLKAQVNVTNPSLTVFTCSSFPTPDTFHLDDIVITEAVGQPDGISSGGSFVLTVPANFNFVTSGSTIISTTGGNLTIGNVSVTTSTISFDINVDPLSLSNFNSITISGVTIQGTGGPSGPGSIFRTISGGTDAVINGDDPGGNVPHGTLTSLLITSPATPGAITGSNTVCDNTTGNAYSIAAVAGAKGYAWTYSGTGATITGNGTSNITINFAGGATSGTLSVTADNACGSSNAATATITIQPSAMGGSITGSTVCYGATGTLTLTGMAGNIIRWEYSIDNGGSWTTMANTTINQDYTNITVPTQYRAVVGNNCGDVFSTVAVVNIRNYWVGITSGDWNTGSNWSDNVIPPSGSCNTYVIPAGTPYSPMLVVNTSVPDIMIASGTNLDLNGYALTINGAVSGTGTLTGSSTSALVINAAAGILHFTPNVYPDSTTNNYLKTITVNSSASATLADSLNIDAGSFGSPGVLSVDGTLNANGNLTMKSQLLSTARITESSGSITGEVTVERYIPGRRAWRFLSMPFSSSNQTIRDAWQEGVNNTDPTLNYANNKNPNPGFGTHITGNNNTSFGFDYNTTTNPSLKVWDQVSQAWSLLQPPTISTQIDSYSAYCLFVRGSRSVDLSQATSAPFNNTVLRIKETLNEANGNSIFRNFTGIPGDMVFVGNPFVSPINLRLIFNHSTGIAGAQTGEAQFWVWDPKLSGPGNFNVGGYVTYTNGIMAPLTGSYPDATAIIQNGQAFMVKLTGVAATMEFRQSDKKDSVQSQIFGLQAAKELRPPAIIYTNLLTSSAGSMLLVDGVAAGFDKKFSSEVDDNDAAKQWNFDENMALVRDGKPLAIELRAISVKTDTLFYKLYLRQQPYALQVFSRNFPADLPVRAWIVDKYLGTYTEVDLYDTTLYNFKPTTDTNSYRNRFMLVFNRTKGKVVKPVKYKEARINKAAIAGIYPNPASGRSFNLNLKNVKKGVYTINIYTTTGKLAVSGRIDYERGKNVYPVVLPLSITSGSYTVQVLSNTGEVISSMSLIINR